MLLDVVKAHTPNATHKMRTHLATLQARMHPESGLHLRGLLERELRKSSPLS
jgi:hypothetical protein